MRAHALARLYPYLKFRAIGSLRMADYSATVIEGLKKFGFSEATVLFFKNQIGDGYYYRSQWRYSGNS